MIASASLAYSADNGRGGIRTHGNSRHIGFQNQHHRPLGHPSIAKNQNRTGDTRIFNPLLYRLSYLGINTQK